MVRGPRILLSLLLGCKAESLGVDVPRGGPEAISQEDLQRDVFALTERGLEDRTAGTRGGDEALRRISDRFQQMHLLPAFGEAYTRPGGLVCGQKDGRSEGAILVAAEERGSGASSAASTAALISLAKAFDVRETPMDTLVLCVWPAEGGLAAYAARPAFPMEKTRKVFVLGPLSGALVEERAALPSGRPYTRLSGTPPAEGDTMDRLDYRALAEQVRALYGQIAPNGL